MTKPKFHLAGETVFHRRHTLEATSFLAPRPDLRNLYGYLYGLALQKSDQVAHAEVLGFDRRLGLLTDLCGDRSDFFTILHGLLGLYRCADLHRAGGIWEKAEPGDTVCLDIGAVEDTLLEIWALPVKLGLVERLEDYPGFKITPDDWGRTRVYHRPPGLPEHFPKKVEFVPMPPLQYRRWPLDEVRSYFRKKIRTMERKYRAQRVDPPLGTAGCLTYPRDRRAPAIGRPPRQRIPLWLARFEQKLEAAAAERDDKLERYDEALEDLKSGHTDVLFPAGTIQVPRRFPARIEPQPAHPLTVIEETVPRARAPA